MSERWLPVVGYEGRYDISDHGRVLTRIGNARFTGPRPLEPAIDPAGRPDVILTARDGTRRHAKVHTLVLTAFVGPRPVGLVCRHLDGDPANNVLANLRWGTHKENCADRARHGTWARPTPRKLKMAQAAEIRALAAQGHTMTALADQFGISITGISKLVRGLSYNDSEAQR